MAPTPPRGFRGAFRTDEDALAIYSEAAGIGRQRPRAIAVPIDAEDAAVLVRWAHENGESLVPRGSGSGMASGAIGAGVIVDLGRMRDMSDPDRDQRSLRAGAGILRGELDRRAGGVGLRFPVDPSSGEFCTIGGMVGTNAAGPHSLRHGSMRPWVLALDCVFADGSRATIRRGEAPARHVPPVRRFMEVVHPVLLASGASAHRGVLKDSSGYAVHAYAQTQELVDLLVGSEGTLALFTAAEIALVPTAAASSSILVSFRDLETAVDAAITARERGAAACELLDRTFLTIAASIGRPLPVSAAMDAALLVDVESDDSGGARSVADGLATAFRTMGAVDVVTAVDARHEAELWSLRHAASPAIARMDPSLRSMQFIEDAAVPPHAVAAYVRGVRATLEACDTRGVIFGHAGDAHVHVNPLLDVRRSDWRQRLERILMDVTDLVASLGGTLTGEHGDGRLRTPLLGRVWDRASLEMFAMIKHAFDPENVLNPGVKVALPGQKAVGAIKYDPALDPLPSAAARRGLDVVERERAYSRFRLDLL